MFSIIKADGIRIFRSKGFYIWLVVFLGLTFLQLFGMNSTAEVGEALFIMDVVGLTEINGSIMPLVFMSDMLTTLYFIVPFVLLVISIDFSSGAIKNILSGGVSRVRYYVAKLLLVLFLTILIHAVSIVIPTIWMTWMRGFGEAFAVEWLWTMTQMFLVQTFVLVGVMSIGIFFAFTTKNTAGALGTFIALTTLPSATIHILQMFGIANVERFARFEPISVLNSIVHWHDWSAADIRHAIMLGFIYLVASIAGSVLLFKKAEMP